jgi:hypothetical protein
MRFRSTGTDSLSSLRRPGDTAASGPALQTRSGVSSVYRISGSIVLESRQISDCSQVYVVKRSSESALNDERESGNLGPKGSHVQELMHDSLLASQFAVRSVAVTRQMSHVTCHMSQQVNRENL